MAENLIINGVDHAKFNLEWAKRGGVVFCVNKFSKDLMLGNVVVGVHDIAWFISVSYQSPNSDWRRCSASSGERLNQFANIRMATPAECAEAGIEYIEYHGWRPIESAPKNGYFIAKDANGVIFKSRRIRNDFEFFDVISGITIFANPTHWMPLPQPPKGE